MDEINKLIEIKKTGVKCTWTNKQANPTFSNIDMIFVSTDWENKFSLCYAFGVVRIGSDHTPIILDDGVQSTQKV